MGSSSTHKNWEFGFGSSPSKRKSTNFAFSFDSNSEIQSRVKSSSHCWKLELVENCWWLQVLVPLFLKSIVILIWVGDWNKIGNLDYQYQRTLANHTPICAACSRSFGALHSKGWVMSSWIVFWCFTGCLYVLIGSIVPIGLPLQYHGGQLDCGIWYLLWCVNHPPSLHS